MADGHHTDEGRRVTYGIRPEHLILANGAGGASFESRVVVVEPTGAETLVVGRAAGHELNVVFRERHQFQPGDTITLLPALENIHLFDAETGQRI